MSNRFFSTWTKGDRRNAEHALRANGVVPIPVECISIKGLEYSRTAKGTSKAHRKPIPLTLDSSPEFGTKYNGNTVEHSIALQDAAVQSATSLMAVMNDMLRSPHVSAHLHKRSTSLQPMHGRPRSHTAPSTPLAEASFPDPVELPGSPPTEHHLRTSLERHADSKSLNTLASESNASLGHTIERPHTSPQEATHPLTEHAHRGRKSLDIAGRHERIVYPFSPDSYQMSASHSTLEQPPPSLNTEERKTTFINEQASTYPRPSLSVLQAPVSDAKSSTPSRASLPAPPKPPTLTPNLTSGNTAQVEDDHNQADIESALMEQLSLMRASHEVHVESLKTAHEQEVRSQRSYIEFLEKHRRSRSVQPTVALPAPKSLSIDTSQARRTGHDLNSDLSTTTLHTFESPLEAQKRSSQESNHETESLKRKLSLMRKSQIDSTDVRRERDHLRDSLDRSDRRILQLKDIVRKAKENEKALRNATEDLQSRLLEANNERMDVREGFYEACVQVRKLTEREAHLSRDLATHRERIRPTNASLTSLMSTNSDQTHDQSKHSRTRSDMSLQVWSHDPLLAQVRALQNACREKDAKILELEGTQTDQARDHALRIEQLEHVVAAQAERINAAEADRDRYDALLRKEIRRQTRLSMVSQSSKSVIPEVEAEATGIVTEKMAQIEDTGRNISSSPTVEGSGFRRSNTHLEQELKACVSEIIMYKLDVVGYRKDLKKANTELERLRALNGQRPPTPDRSSTGSHASQPGSDKRKPPSLDLGKDPSTSGLGISLAQAPKTPTRAMAPTASSANEAPSPANTSLAVPVASPRTPTNRQKQLPRTPATCTPSPLAKHSPSMKSLQRGETLRSLSESIISSYTKRTPPAAEVMRVPSTRMARSSDPVSRGSSHMSSRQGEVGMGIAQPS